MSKGSKGDDGILGLQEVIRNKNLIIRMLFAEFLGTFLLVFIGCGAVLSVSDTKSNFVQIALAFGLTIGTLVKALRHVSGACLNPAVTLSFFVVGEMKLLKTLLYIIAEVLGAIVGAFVLKAAVPSEIATTLGVTTLNNKLTPFQGLLIEGILTFLLVLIIHAVCDAKRSDHKGSTALAIGLAITACHVCAIQYTGSSLNPARSVGPALATGIWDDHWIYWAGPILGGLFAGLIYKFILQVHIEPDELP